MKEFKNVYKKNTQNIILFSFHMYLHCEWEDTRLQIPFHEYFDKLSFAFSGQEYDEKPLEFMSMSKNKNSHNSSFRHENHARKIIQHLWTKSG